MRIPPREKTMPNKYGKGKGAKGGGKGKGKGKGKASKGKGKVGLPVIVGVAKPPPRRGPARGVKQVRVTVTPILPCGIKKLLKSRIDEILLYVHLEAIEAHRLKYENRIQHAQAQNLLGNAAEMGGIPAHKAKMTEATGEREATLLVIQKFASGNGDFQLLYGFAAGVGIDQIWHSPSTDTYMLVEAKGPGAALSTGAIKGDQMSKQWVENSLISITNSSNSTLGEIADAQRMLEAMNDGPPPHVIGKVIEALPGGGACERGCPDKGIYHAT
jgi:hypothetical protein